jgi:polysaccharide deacetylase family protein (PEP-CTERM system associated)
MLNILTIDLEDYFQVHAFSRTIRYEDWDKFECRIERNTDHLLEMLGEVKTQHSALSTWSLDNSLTHSHINSSSNVSEPQLRSNNPIRATFFVLGWIAERYPDLIRRIQKEGHEISCHGYAHRLVYTQSREEFRQDVKRAKSILEDITGKEVIGYRAPSYSITNKSQWAFEVLVEEGFKYDSSIFPIRHDFYGMREAPRFPFVVSFKGNDNFEFSMLNFELGTAALHHSSTAALNNSLTHSLIHPSSHISAQQHRNTAALNNSLTHSLINSRALIEFPISTVKLFGQNIPISGGGYFRLFPYSLIRRGLKSISKKEGKPFIFYMHPWEIDPNQPRVSGVSSRSRFRHYVNLDKTEDRFRRLLIDFSFSSVKRILQLSNPITH